MKEYIPLLLLGFILVINIPVAANFELEAGMSYNTLNMEQFNNFLDNRNSELDNMFGGQYSTSFADVKSGNAYLISGRYWITDQLALGLGTEIFGSMGSMDPEYIISGGYETLYSETIALDLMSALSELKFNLIDRDEVELNLTASGGKYYSDLNYEKQYNFGENGNESETYQYQDSAWGGKFGLDSSHNIIDNIELKTRFNYRYLKMANFKNDSGEKFFDFYQEEPLEADFSGFEIGGTVLILF